MSELRNLQPGDIDDLHEEALTINGEIEERRITDFESSNSYLADIAITERAERFANLFSDHPEVMEKMKQTYQYRDIACLELYIDPASLESDADKIQSWQEYFTSENFSNDLSKFERYIPAYYRGHTELPPLFVHSKATSKEISRLHNARAAVFHGNVMGNIHYVSSEVPQDSRYTFYHELTHTRQNNHPDNLLFKEGVADMIANRITGTDSHASFIKVFDQYVLGKDIDHPMARSVAPDGTFELELRELIDELAILRIDDLSPEDLAVICTKYQFMASFLTWYQGKYDPDLAFISRSSKTTPNYFRMYQSLFDSFPLQVNRPTAPDGTRLSAEFLDAMPDDLRLFSNQLMMIAVPDSDPLVAEYADRAESAKTPEEVANICREFAAISEQRLDRIQSEYNEFINEQAAVVRKNGKAA